jgi:hypothetical protein
MSVYIYIYTQVYIYIYIYIYTYIYIYIYIYTSQCRSYTHYQVTHWFVVVMCLPPDDDIESDDDMPPLVSSEESDDSQWVSSDTDGEPEGDESDTDVAYLTSNLFCSIYVAYVAGNVYTVAATSSNGRGVTPSWHICMERSLYFALTLRYNGPSHYAEAGDSLSTLDDACKRLSRLQGTFGVEEKDAYDNDSKEDLPELSNGDGDYGDTHLRREGLYVIRGHTHEESDHSGPA